MFGTASIPNRPTFKLALAAVLLCLAIALSLTKKLLPEENGGWLQALLLIPNSAFIFYAVFRIAAFQIMIGIMALIAGLASGAMILVAVITAMVSGKSFGPFLDIGLLVITLWALLTGSLLVIDKEVVEYRRQLGLRFPAKDRLNPKVDNLPDDPINPS